MTGRSARFYTSGRFFMRTSSYSSMKSYDSSSVNFQTSKKQSPRFLLIAPWKLSQQICTNSAISLVNIMTFSYRISVASEKFLIEQNPNIAITFFPGIIGSIRPPKQRVEEWERLILFQIFWAKVHEFCRTKSLTFLHIFCDDFRSCFSKSNREKCSYFHNRRFERVCFISLLFR